MQPRRPRADFMQHPLPKRCRGPKHKTGFGHGDPAARHPQPKSLETGRADDQDQPHQHRRIRDPESPPVIKDRSLNPRESHHGHDRHQQSPRPPDQARQPHDHVCNQTFGLRLVKKNKLGIHQVSVSTRRSDAEPSANVPGTTGSAALGHVPV